MPLFRYLQETKTNHFVRCQFADFLALKRNGASAGRVKTANYVEEGALSRSIASNKRDYLSFLDMEGHSTKYLNVAIVC